MITLPPRQLLARLPRIYQTEPIPAPDKIIHLHFFFHNCDWFAAEFDGEDQFFGFVCLGDPVMAEWGYFSLAELRKVQMGVPVIGADTGRLLGHLPAFVEWDEYWRPKPFGEIRLTATSYASSS